MGTAANKQGTMVVAFPPNSKIKYYKKGEQIVFSTATHHGVVPSAHLALDLSCAQYVIMLELVC
jgi:hypothetical protein